MTSTKSAKTIWILNHYAGSRIHGMEYRHYYLAKHFKQMGFAPAIVCASFHHLMTKLPDSMSAEVDGIPYVWIKTCRYEGNHVGRVINMLEYSFRLVFRSLRQLPPPDIVIASSPHPFAAVNGYRFAKKHRAKFIFEVRDLWPLTLLDVGGHSPHHPFVRAMAWAERMAYERCDYTVSLVPGGKDYMVAHGLDERKFVHIPNGFEPQSSQGDLEALPDEHSRVIDALKKAGRRIVLYSGNHGIVNALDNVVEAAALLKDESRVHILLVGQGPEKARLQKQARQADLENVTFLPPVARGQMPTLTRAVDAGYIGLQKKDLFKYGVSPNKLFEYMSAGLPVIFAIDTTHDEVARARCGFSIGAENPSALADTLRTIGALPAAQLREMGTRAREHVSNTNTYDVLARQYADLF